MEDKYCSQCGTAMVDGVCQNCAEAEPDAPAPEKTNWGCGCLSVMAIAFILIIGIVSFNGCVDNGEKQYQQDKQEWQQYKDNLHQESQDWKDTLRELQEQE